ncbi:MAG: O-antigen ligase family protein [Oscillibacter sp.]|nr:O-antigen ligase family protein [Oscillibacter sp.]
MDYFVFPLVIAAAFLMYVLTLGKLCHEKRSPLKEFEKHPAFLLFLFLLAWMSVGMACVHGATHEVAYGLGLNHETFLRQIEYFAGFFALGVTLQNKHWKRWFLRGVTVVSVILVPCSFYLWQYTHASLIYPDWEPWFSCVWTNPNYYGYFLTVFISLSAGGLAGAESRGWRAFYAAALVANSVTLCYNDTLGAWIGTLCGCLFPVLAYRLRDGRWNRRTLAALGLFLLSMYAAGVVNGNLSPNILKLFKDIILILTQPNAEATKHAGSGRWFIWLRCMELIRQYPLFGIGFEGIMAKDLLSFAGNARPHNEYMQYALFYGIPAAILYTLGCASIYVRAWRRRAVLDNVTLAALTAAFGYLCGAFFGLTVYNTAPYLFIMLGLGYVRETAQAAETTESVETAQAAETTETVENTD